MNICARNCKYYEECIPYRYNNIKQSYMTKTTTGKMQDNLPVIYVSECMRFKRGKGFSKSLRQVLRVRDIHKSKRWKDKRNYIYL